MVPFGVILTRGNNTLLYYRLTSLMQGDNMINPEIKLTDSILEVKAVGSIQDVQNDFNCVQTKSIAELLDAEKEEDKNNEEKKE